MEYFEHKFIGSERTCITNKPLFNESFWEYHVLVGEIIPKPDYIREAYNWKLKNSTNCAHPVLWIFLDALKSKQANTRIFANEFLTGHYQESPMKKYKALNAILHLTVLLHENEYQNGDMMEHATSLACGIQY